jgi:hypothetical protein
MATKRTFKWTAKRTEAALLVREDDLGDKATAAKPGIGMRADYMEETPEFADRVKDNVATFASVAERFAGAKVD